MKKHMLHSSFTLLSLVFFLAACQNGPSSSSEENSYYTSESYEFTTLFQGKETKTLASYDKANPTANGFVNYALDYDIGMANYLKMEYQASENIVGYFDYVSQEGNQSNSEKFFLSKDETTFTTFLDAYRVGAYGAFAKKLTGIRIQNVGTAEASFVLRSLSISDRSMPRSDSMLYVSSPSMIVGTSFQYGGAIQYVERTDLDICEYMDANGNICIDRDIDPRQVKLVNDRVNFVNIYDLGREIQASYYLNANEKNGYHPKTQLSYSGLDNLVKYNPIQCGSPTFNTPQIIDFIYHKDYFWVKVKPLDWFYDNDPCSGYMETTISFGNDGVILVDNSYVDFSQFVDNEENPLVYNPQETPATMTVYPLNYFYCETKRGTIMDQNTSGIPQSESVLTSANQTGSGAYYYSLFASTLKYDWMAMVNENYFGLGICMENADHYVGSHSYASTNYYAEAMNRKIAPSRFSFEESDIIPSYAAYNDGYMCPGIDRKMIDFVPLQYSYALCVGDTQTMGDEFAALKASGRIANESLLQADGIHSWPKR